MLTECIIPEKSVQVRSADAAHKILGAFPSRRIETTLDRLEIHEDGRVDVGGEDIVFGQSFLEACARQIGLSLKYAYACSFDLFKANFDGRKKQCSKAITMCLSREIAVNICNSGYTPAATHDLLDALLRDNEVSRFQSAVISDRGAEVNVISRQAVVEPEPGDMVELGIRMSTSETGFRRGCKASLFTHRLVCKNGAILADELGAARWNYDRRVTYSASLEKFRRDVDGLRAHEELVRRAYEGITGRHMPDVAVVRFWRLLRNAFKDSDAPAKVADALMGIEAEERSSLQHAVRERGPDDQPRMTHIDVWGVHNRITYMAQSQGFQRRTRLEELGGRLVTATV